MKKRKRPERITVYVTPEEKELIHTKMDQLGTENVGAYMRKIAIDGYVVNLDIPELRELTTLLRRSSANLNQLTKRVHEMGRIYDADIESLRAEFKKLMNSTKLIIDVLSSIS